MRPKPLFVFGISTISRGSKSYLIDTLKSLTSKLKNEERVQCLFVIQVSDCIPQKGMEIVRKINATFYADIENGLIEVTLVDPDFYPPISIFSKTQETPRRVYWRSKQNLDFIYLMNFSKDKAQFYVQLEDDITARVNTKLSFALNYTCCFSSFSNSFLASFDIFVLYYVTKYSKIL